jgi:hypothetical protein
MGLFASATAPIGAIASAIPGKEERQYRQDIKSDRARLAGGAGGMTASQRGALMSEGMNQIQSQQAANTAALSRGAATDGGESGQRDAAVLASQKAAEGAQNALGSDVRNQDLALAESQRQQLYARMAQARAWGQQRKQESLGYVQATGQGIDDAIQQQGQQAKDTFTKAAPIAAMAAS